MERLLGLGFEGEDLQGFLNRLLVCRTRLDEPNFAIILRHNFTDVCIVFGIVSNRDINFGHGYSTARREVVVDNNPFGIN